ncbi:RNA 2',3'-cyclic phosphodiesterase [Paenibacillus sp. WLX1005]|uniref:RNA 2',3'-cyclic phosphodiesterase n=1 Tax=Paenibacillus sp. WLX1005 TaxID=3243766 RepID=UPI003983EF83
MTERGQERVFAAIPLTGEAQRVLAEWSREMQTRYPFRKWTWHEDLHITLQFFGDVDIAQLPKLHEALAAATQQVEPFMLKLGKPDTFGVPERPRVWWIQMQGALDTLRQLQQHVQQECEHLGFKPEQRAYTPHITIARKYADSTPFVPLPSAQYPSSAQWVADEIVLYHTRLGQIPMYEPAMRFPLGKS